MVRATTLAIASMDATRVSQKVAISLIHLIQQRRRKWSAWTTSHHRQRMALKTGAAERYRLRLRQGSRICCHSLRRLLAICDCLWTRNLGQRIAFSRIHSTTRSLKSQATFRGTRPSTMHSVSSHKRTTPSPVRAQVPTCAHHTWKVITMKMIGAFKTQNHKSLC